jgi:hypothetical protein
MIADLGREWKRGVMTLRSLVQAGAGPLAARAVTGGGEVSPPAVRDEEELHVVRAELVLAADAVRALREVPLRPDLLQSFAVAVMDVRPELGERVEVCVDLVPLTAAKAARIRDRISPAEAWRELEGRRFSPARAAGISAVLPVASLEQVSGRGSARSPRR